MTKKAQGGAGNRGGARKGAGRPLTGMAKKIQASFTLEPLLLVKLDELAATRGVSRSEALGWVLSHADFEALARDTVVPDGEGEGR